MRNPQVQACPHCDRIVRHVENDYDGVQVFTAFCDYCDFTWLPSSEESYLNSKLALNRKSEIDNLKSIVRDLLSKVTIMDSNGFTVAGWTGDVYDRAMDAIDGWDDDTV